MSGDRLVTGLVSAGVTPADEIALLKKQNKSEDEKNASILGLAFKILIGVGSVFGMAFMAFLFAQDALVGLGVLIGATIALGPFTWLTLGFAAVFTWLMYSAYATTFGMNMVFPFKEKEKQPEATAPSARLLKILVWVTGPMDSGFFALGAMKGVTKVVIALSAKGVIVSGGTAAALITGFGLVAGVCIFIAFLSLYIPAALYYVDKLYNQMDQAERDGQPIRYSSILFSKNGLLAISTIVGTAAIMFFSTFNSAGLLAHIFGTAIFPWIRTIAWASVLSSLVMTILSKGVPVYENKHDPVTYPDTTAGTVISGYSKVVGYSTSVLMAVAAGMGIIAATGITLTMPVYLIVLSVLAAIIVAIGQYAGFIYYNVNLINHYFGKFAEVISGTPADAPEPAIDTTPSSDRKMNDAGLVSGDGVHHSPESSDDRNFRDAVDHSATAVSPEQYSDTPTNGLLKNKGAPNAPASGGILALVKGAFPSSNGGGVPVST